MNYREDIKSGQHKTLALSQVRSTKKVSIRNLRSKKLKGGEKA
jgi:hypothetical protein